MPWRVDPLTWEWVMRHLMGTYTRFTCLCACVCLCVCVCQAKLFNEEGTGFDVLVASDAIGMVCTPCVRLACV